MNEEVVQNVQAELNLVGSLFKKPDLYVTFGRYIRSQYDFSDEATRFFYDSFETYYLTYSKDVDQIKWNMFVSQDEERLRMNKKLGGWNTIKSFMSVADTADCKNYYDLVKKFSLLREYGRNGFPVEKIMAIKNFDKLKPIDIYRIIRQKADQIHTIINCDTEAVNLGSDMHETLLSYVQAPRMGLPTPWYLYNEMMFGLQNGDVIFEGFLSNEGKTRKLILLAAWVVYHEGRDFLMMSNEMAEDKLKSALLTTILNNKCFQELHGVTLNKPEREIVLGAYKDRDTGDYIRRLVDDNGAYIETNEEFIKRIRERSDELSAVERVTEWIQNYRAAKLMFLDIGDDYSDERVEQELRKYRLTRKVTYYGYDTLKGYKTDDWSVIKQTATMLKEVTKELQMSGFAVFQLSDDTVFTDMFTLSSNNIANSKHIKHVTDVLTMGKKIAKEDYYKYQLVLEDPNNVWGKPVYTDLDYKKTYFGIKIDKNRSGNKDKLMAFVIDLDLNTWDNVGYFIKKKITKEK